jgi:uncharacterized protein DUF3467
MVCGLLFWIYYCVIRGIIPTVARKGNKTKASPRLVRVQPRLDPTPETPFYYSNYMSVTHTEYEFTLNVGRIPANLTTEQIEAVKKGQPVSLEPILQLLVPPSVIKGLISALTDQVKTYEERFGKISRDVKENGN